MNLKHMLKKRIVQLDQGHLPILANKACAQPARIPSVTTSPKEDAMGHAMLSIQMIESWFPFGYGHVLPGSMRNLRLRMIKKHIKTPRTKLEIAADIIELVMIRILSETVAGSCGCSRIPSINENKPAMDPAIKAWT